MKRCCIEAFARQAIADNFRLADEGEMSVCPTCAAIHQKTNGVFVEQNEVPIYVVYYNTSDYPGEYCARRQIASKTGVWVDANLCARGATLEAVREQLPGMGVNLYRLPPMPGDDPVVVEIWL